MNFIYFPIFIGAILLIWFRTEAYVEYCKLLRLKFLCNYKDYEEKKQKEDCRLTYHGYLRQYKNSFFVRLVTCPICLSVWLSFLLPATITGILTSASFLSTLPVIVCLFILPFAILLSIFLQILFYTPTSLIYMLGGLLIYSIINKLLN